jgi:hypothetical protein
VWSEIAAMTLMAAGGRTWRCSIWGSGRWFGMGLQVDSGGGDLGAAAWWRASWHDLGLAGGRA